MRRPLPPVSYRVLSTFLIVGLPALAIATVIALGVGQGRLRDSYEAHLAEMAEHAASAVDTFVFRRIVDAAVLTRVPSVREAAAQGTAAPLDTGQVAALDREWQQTMKVPQALTGLMTSETSTFFADVIRQDPIYREIMLTDLHGRLVAASNITSDYLQADEAWWREAYGDGVRGQPSIGDVRYDESARAFAVDIALPVTEPGTDRLTGVLRIAADIREMGAIIDAVRLGETGDAALLREDGSIVFTRRRVDADAQFFAADLLRERFDAIRRGDPEYRVTFSARGPDGEDRLVAVAPSQLSSSYPNLAWLVAVSQSESELFAPVTAQAWLVLVVIGVVALIVIGLALWFSMRLSRPMVSEELDMHLVEHAKTPHIEEHA